MTIELRGSHCAEPTASGASLGHAKDKPPAGLQRLQEVFMMAVDQEAQSWSNAALTQIRNYHCHR